MARSRYLPDNFTLTLIAAVAIASLFPAQGHAAVYLEVATKIAIAILFFLHGAKLSKEAVIAGAMHWRLHTLVVLFTFGVFPLLGWALKPLLAPLVTPELYLGILFLCTLPATVQSAIAFTSIARGNIPAAICSASASTLIGIFLTPLLVNMMGISENSSEFSWDAVGRIMVQLFLPFVAGQCLRPWVGAWISRKAYVLRYVDQGSITLVVYTAFSAAVVQGLWQQIAWLDLVGLFGVCIILLALVLFSTAWLGKIMGFSKEDQITIIFCASKKSLASGVPMAKVIFSSGAVGAIVLPLMIFHQMQLMVCAVLAQHYAHRPEVDN